MEFLNYDDLYEDAVIDFSSRMGLKPYKYPLEQPTEEPITQSLDIYQDNLPISYTSLEQTENTLSTSRKEKLNYSLFKGFELFNRIYDKVLAYNPDAAKYRDVLTKLASRESSFTPKVTNSIGAAGYFLFIDSTRTNIMKKLGKSTNKQYFLDNPEVQILAAIELAKLFEKSFSKEDIQKALNKGHSINGLIAGAWLGGVGGVRKYLNKGLDSSDGGSSVSKYIKMGDLV